ncbi:MAG: hypothetical protein Q9164_000124 [Protoblastenia rupestris]
MNNLVQDYLQKHLEFTQRIQAPGSGVHGREPTLPQIFQSILLPHTCYLHRQQAQA